MVPFVIVLPSVSTVGFKKLPFSSCLLLAISTYFSADGMILSLISEISSSRSISNTAAFTFTASFSLLTLAVKYAKDPPIPTRIIKASNINNVNNVFFQAY